MRKERLEVIRELLKDIGLDGDVVDQKFDDAFKIMEEVSLAKTREERIEILKKQPATIILMQGMKSELKVNDDEIMTALETDPKLIAHIEEKFITKNVLHRINVHNIKGITDVLKDETYELNYFDYLEMLETCYNVLKADSTIENKEFFEQVKAVNKAIINALSEEKRLYIINN